MSELTQARLKEVIHYNPKTGDLWRKYNKFNRITDCKDNRGYIVVRIDGKNYKGHRLAFLFMTGKFPSNVTDHINSVRNDNRWVNIRPATMIENGRNRSSIKNSSSKYLGVGWHIRGKKWQASIQFNNTTYHIGCYKKEKQAALARDVISKEFFKKFAKFNFPNEVLTDKVLIKKVKLVICKIKTDLATLK